MEKSGYYARAPLYLLLSRASCEMSPRPKHYTRLYIMHLVPLHAPTTLVQVPLAAMALTRVAAGAGAEPAAVARVEICALACLVHLLLLV